MTDKLVSNPSQTAAKVLKLGIAVAALIVLYQARPFTTVAEYERGVVTRFGSIVRTAEPGFNFRIPVIEAVHIFPVNIQSLVVDNVQTYTIDNQQLTARININFSIPPDGVVNIYKNVPDYQVRLQTMVIDRFKNALGKLNVVDVTKNRADIAASIFNNIKDESQRLYGLTVVDLQIINIDYTNEFEQATERAMTAKAVVEQREQEKRQAEVEAAKAAIIAKGEANAKIEAAKGEAEAKLAIARANAESIRMEGLARAEALKAQSSVVTKELVDMKKAEQWNGQLPAQMLGGTIPLMQIDK